MIRVYQNISPRFGRGIQRVASAIEQYAPRERVTFTEVVGSTRIPADAELVIHHVIGVQNFHPEATIDQLIAAHPHVRHVVIQYCLRTTENPDPVWWNDNVWAKCDVVWSYYDLGRLLNEASTYAKYYDPGVNPAFYEAPLGVDPVFHGSPWDRPKHPIFLCCTSGHIPETEGVLEVVEAAARVGGRVLHLGPRSLLLGPHVSYAEGISDQELAALYKSCKFVAGLRRVEGFELPAAEGLCSGAIPICFDQPHYRRWFGDAALYVPETEPDHVRESIEQIFRYGQRRLDPVDVTLAQRKFSWPRVVEEFWKRIFKEGNREAVQES